MSFGIYLVGVLLVVGGLIYAAVLMNIPTHWIAVVTIVVLGAAVMKGVQTTRGKDPA